MNVYKWTKNVATGYSDGIIIVIASTLEEAREAAISEIYKEYEEIWGKDFDKDDEDTDYGFGREILDPLNLEPDIEEIKHIPLVYFKRGGD